MDSPATAGSQLSLQQKHVWKLQGDQQFVSQVAVLLQGDLDQQRLHNALIGIFQRHQILRAFFHRSPGMEFPVQMVEENAAFSCFRSSLPDVDPGSEEDHVRSALRTQAETDLLDGSALDVALIDAAPDRHFVLFTLPALCADFVTLKNLVVELQEHYAGLVSAGNRFQQYGDYSTWQDQSLQNTDAQTQTGRTFWREQSSPLNAPLILQSKKTPEAHAVYVPGTLQVFLPDNVLDKVSASGEDLGNWLLSAWQVLLWQLRGRTDFAIGFVSDGRGHAKLANALGLYTRTLPLRVRLAPNGSFAEHMTATAKSRALAIEHQDYYDRTEDALPIGFITEEEISPQVAHGLRISVYAIRCETERFQLALKCRRSAHTWSAELVYDPAYFDRDAVERLSQQFSTILAAASSNPIATVASVADLHQSQGKLAKAFDPAVHLSGGSIIDNEADE